MLRTSVQSAGSDGKMQKRNGTYAQKNLRVITPCTRISAHDDEPKTEWAEEKVG
jgi:hypothetical protein